MCINARNQRENRQFVQFSGYTYREMENDLHIFSKIFKGIMELKQLVIRWTAGNYITCVWGMKTRLTRF